MDRPPEQDAEVGSSGASQVPTPGGGPATPAAPGDKAAQQINQYKRLLIQSRQMLENYQKKLQEKERIVEHLAHELQTTRQQRQSAVAAVAASGDGGFAGGSGASTAEPHPSGAGDSRKAVPHRALRRVDVNGGISVLFEFETGEDQWRIFHNDLELSDFIRRDSGEPLALPLACLTPEESEHVAEEAKNSVAKITEEFRRFRVRAEISRKQKDAEARQATASSIAEQQRRINGQDVESELQKARLQAEQVVQLREQLADQEERWRKQCDKLSRENEKLRSEGSEAALAAQWRQRYEQCSREKAELVAKLSIVSTPAEARSTTGDFSSLVKQYEDLREEYKLYRKRAMEAIQEKELLLAQSGAAALRFAGGRPSRRGASPVPHPPPLEDPRFQYLKNLMIKYLCTDEFEAREHMERAVMTVLQFSDAEQSFVQERRAESSVAWLTNWLPSVPNLE
uniref:GRIP domain-containing protein n=1 Tax=Rhizochromulina marina TaxID=1034831 RepID=A0A7S2S2V8_9STRA